MFLSAGSRFYRRRTTKGTNLYENLYKDTEQGTASSVVEKTSTEIVLQARSQDFLWGGGGGAYLKNRDQIMNVLNDTLC